jgi:lysophospholipase L1-like esterase
VTLRLAVLGDSIGAGQGATVAAERLAPRLTAGLAAHGIDATHRVFAVSGARSSALRAQVDRALAWEPTVAVVVIGANDLSHQTPPDSAARDLGDAVRRLRATGAEVVVAPAPDLSTMPQVPAFLRQPLRTASATLRERQVAAATGNGGRVADHAGSTSAAFASDASMFSHDRFHPSGAGYAVIAAALLPEVHAAALSRQQPI